ncbi:MAG: hypothetical protein D6B25_05470 [Desulfobulbaceae bacterium]|nr:MAG: hypothetical protein D6B25_05470 [Desulfobulbaceae bacterium]
MTKGSNKKHEWLGGVGFMCLALFLPLYSVKPLLGVPFLLLSLLLATIQMDRGQQRVQRIFALVTILLGCFFALALFVTFGAL